MAFVNMGIVGKVHLEKSLPFSGWYPGRGGSGVANKGLLPVLDRAEEGFLNPLGPEFRCVPCVDDETVCIRRRGDEDRNARQRHRARVGSPGGGHLGEGNVERDRFGSGDNGRKCVIHSRSACRAPENCLPTACGFSASTPHLGD